MAELKPCPVCGSAAMVLHMYDTYDRADFGWDAGCPRYKKDDGIHTEEMRVSGFVNKDAAIEAWNKLVEIDHFRRAEDGK